MYTDPPKLDVKSLYDIYRKYMEHEDDLLNHRSTWHLLIQGFLFGTLGVIGEWHLSTNGADTLYEERHWLIFVLAAVGMLIALCAFLSVNAADNSIEQLCIDWEKIRAPHEQEEEWKLLPEIAGGGHGTAKTFGKFAAISIPLIIVAAWVIIFCMAVIDRLCHSATPRAVQTPVVLDRHHQCGAPIADHREQLTRQDLVSEIACSINNAQELQVLLDRFNTKVSITHPAAKPRTKHSSKGPS